MEGQTALKYLRGGQKYAQVGTCEVVFISQNNISLAWVPDELVPQFLSIKGGCCGQKKPIFFLASETDIRRWQFGGR